MKRLNVHVAVANLTVAERLVLETCCYARSEKSWIDDPQGIQWETFLTRAESTVYGHDLVRELSPFLAEPSSCCAPICCGSDAVGWS